MPDASNVVAAYEDVLEELQHEDQVLQPVAVRLRAALLQLRPGLPPHAEPGVLVELVHEEAEHVRRLPEAALHVAVEVRRDGQLLQQVEAPAQRQHRQRCRLAGQRRQRVARLVRALLRLVLAAPRDELN